MTTPTRALYVYSGDGLCNRLMLLLSGRVLAEASDRTFEMHWYPKVTCNCPFDQLFQGDWNVRLIHQFDASEWTDLRLKPPNRPIDFLQSTEPVLRLRHYEWLIHPDVFPAHRALQTRMEETFRLFQPTPEILQRINAFQAQSFRPTMLGVHIRRGDFIHSRQDRTGNLDNALAAVEQYLALAPDAGILLCTDDGAPEPHSGIPSAYQGVREQFQQRFGARVVSTTPRSLNRDSPEAIQDAVMDMMLLRRTQYFVGTTDSTFSYFAVFARDVPYTMASGANAAYQARQLFLKRTGIYYALRTVGRLEFGPNIPYWYLVNLYKRRLIVLRQILSGKRGFSSDPSARD